MLLFLSYVNATKIVQFTYTAPEATTSSSVIDSSDPEHTTFTNRERGNSSLGVNTGTHEKDGQIQSKELSPEQSAFIVTYSSIACGLVDDKHGVAVQIFPQGNE